MNGFFQVFYAVFSGILTALALPNEFFYFGSPFFGMIALIPLYIAAKEAKSYKMAALLFAIDALTTHLLSSFWLANFKEFAALTLGASAVGTACIEAMAGCAFFATQKMRMVQGTGYRIRFAEANSLTHDPCPLFTVTWFSCIRVIYEWAKSTGFLAYPWGTIYMSAYRSKILIQSADIFGVYGITFLFAFISATLGETLTANVFFRKECKNVRSSEPTRKIICTSEARLRNEVSSKPFCEAGTAGEHFLHYSLIKCTFAMIVCFSLYGAYQLCVPRQQIKTLNAVLVQSNKDSWAASGSRDDTEAIETSIRLTEDGIKEFKEQETEPDIVLWSEAVLLKKFPMRYAYYTMRPESKPLISFIKDCGVPFLIGGSYILNLEKAQEANAALFFDKEGLLRGYYGKTHLVPFAEAVPGTEYEAIRKILKKIMGFSNGWTPGQEFTLFDLPLKTPDIKPFPSFRFIDISQTSRDEKEHQTKLRVATPICFEDAFPDICGPFHDAGAEVFLNITDDSWSKTNSAEYQHFVVAAFRAIEYRTTLVRSTNAGYTVVVDPCGRVLQSLPLFEEGYLCARVPVYQHKQTVHSRFTNWFVHLILIFMAIVYVKIATRICSGLTPFTCKINRVAKKERPSLKDSVETALMEIEF